MAGRFAGIVNPVFGKFYRKTMKRAFVQPGNKAFNHLLCKQLQTGKLPKLFRFKLCGQGSSVLVCMGYSWLFSLPSSTDLGTAPTCLSTILPPLKNRIVGILRIPNSADTLGLLSTSTLPITALPSYSLESSSTKGPTIRQGPHHSAQKSSITGLSDFRTNSWKFESVISIAIVSKFRSTKIRKSDGF